MRSVTHACRPGVTPSVMRSSIGLRGAPAQVPRPDREEAYRNNGARRHGDAAGEAFSQRGQHPILYLTVVDTWRGYPLSTSA
jgi:hypothetical protein